jgi:hypothetical protein
MQPHDGHTLLHEMASRGPPPATDIKGNLEWNKIVTELDADGAWSMFGGRIRFGEFLLTIVGTLRTLDGTTKTAQEIALDYGRVDLAKLFEPRYYRHFEEKMLASIEMQLHQLMREYAGRYVWM